MNANPEDHNNIFGLPSASRKSDGPETKNLEWFEPKWNDTPEHVEYVVRTLVPHSDYLTNPDWKNVLKGKAASHFNDKNLPVLRGLEGDVTTQQGEVKKGTAKVQQTMDQLENLERQKLKYVQDPTIKRLSTPKGWHLLVAVALILILVGLIVWTLLNTSNLILSAVDDYKKALLIVSPLALCPVLVKLIVDRIPASWRSRAYGMLAGVSAVAFIVWTICLTKNYLKPVDFNSLFSGRTESKSIGIQLGCQIALEVSLGALLFKQLFEIFWTQPCFTEVYLEAEKVCVTAKQELATLCSDLKRGEQRRDSFPSVRQTFVTNCLNAGEAHRPVLLANEAHHQHLRNTANAAIKGI